MNKPSKNRKPRHRGRGKRIFAMILAGLMALLFLVPYLMQIVGYAESSAEIMQKIQGLQNSADELESKQTELRSNITESQNQAMDYVAQKAVIDQTLQVTQERINNTQDQIQAYNLLIASRQQELEEAQAAEDQMYEKYKSRIRAIEEYGDISYWAVLFQAHSLSDILDSLEMIRKIAESDQKMLQELSEVSEQIQAARDELESARQELETTKAQLGEQQSELAEQQEQSDALILAMTGDVAAMEEVSAYYEQQKQQLSAEIAENLKEYYIAAAQEEALSAAQAAVTAAKTAAGDAETYANQAETYYSDTVGYVAVAQSAVTASAAQEAWDNAVWSAYLAQQQADRALNMVTAVQNEAEEARRQTLTNPNAEPCISMAAAYEAPARAAAERAQAAADSAAAVAAQAEAYVEALNATEADQPAASATITTPAETEKQEPEDTSSYVASYSETLSGFASPLQAGTSYVSSAYGNREHPIYGYYTFHNGVDLAADAGTPIYATKAGTVVAAAYSDANGNYVTISHAGGVSSCYLHMTSYCVHAGDSVTQGQLIGYVGSTGNSTGPHLHFSMLVDGVYVNPMEYVSIS